jgi:hypothetical protein
MAAGATTASRATTGSSGQSVTCALPRTASTTTLATKPTSVSVTLKAISNGSSCAATTAMASRFP